MILAECKRRQCVTYIQHVSNIMEFRVFSTEFCCAANVRSKEEHSLLVASRQPLHYHTSTHIEYARTAGRLRFLFLYYPCRIHAFPLELRGSGSCQERKPIDCSPPESVFRLIGEAEIASSYQTIAH